jgi:xanthine dehydrogenase accessory factor
MALQNREIRYLGMIGSKTKKYRFQMRFVAGEYDTNIFSKLHTPAGIDIGAETPMEIAISIAAELISNKK